MLATEFIEDYKELIRENKQLREEKKELEGRIQGLERAVLELARRLDDTDIEIGLRANNLQAIKTILQG